MIYKTVQQILNRSNVLAETNVTVYGQSNRGIFILIEYSALHFINCPVSLTLSEVILLPVIVQATNSVT